MKKLLRSKDNKIVSGILGGLGEYYEIDPALVRLIFIVVTLITGVIPMAIAYIIALFVVPKPN